jgi:hypothetical protein
MKGKDVSDRAVDKSAPTTRGEMDYQEAREIYEDNARSIFRKARRRLFDARVKHQSMPTEANTRELEDAKADFALASVWM